MTSDKWTDTDELKRVSGFIAERTGGRVALTTYSPGDGVTRYRLGVMDADAPYHDYFGDRTLVTVCGRRAAVGMCAAFLAGANEGNVTR